MDYFYLNTSCYNLLTPLNYVTFFLIMMGILIFYKALPVFGASAVSFVASL